MMIALAVCAVAVLTATVVGMRGLLGGADSAALRPSRTTVPQVGSVSPSAAPASGPSVVPAPCTVQSVVAQWPLRRRLAQTVMVGVDASGPQEALGVVSSEQVGGIFLGGTSTGLLSGGGLREVQAAAVVEVAVAVDDEGGRVQRIDTLDGELPSAREMAATLSVEQVYVLAAERGRQLRARGVTINLAPSVDVSAQPDGAVIGDRSFGDDPQLVTRYADAFARGLRDAGVLPVFKHFPGHGRATGDSHQGRVTTPPLTGLREVDLVPYRHLLDGRAAAVMVGHLDVPGLTEPTTPASLSPAAHALLREELGFAGMVITDDLAAMAAVTDRADLPDAVRRALAAGADMALWITTDRLTDVLDHLEHAVATGSLPESRVNDAVAHVLAAKNIDLCRTATPHPK